MATIGQGITELTPSRGFAAEFAAATTVLICSRLGLPISTTHTLVGAVIGVALARGMSALNVRVVRGIIKSWLITLPFTGLLTMLIYKILLWLL
jgi:PiT family inorganic phosphate transporter